MPLSLLALKHCPKSFVLWIDNHNIQCDDMPPLELKNWFGPPARSGCKRITITNLVTNEGFKEWFKEWCSINCVHCKLNMRYLMSSSQSLRVQNKRFNVNWS